jgi:dinuclear metal center YbgI/SA1388 family protein
MVVTFLHETMSGTALKEIVAHSNRLLQPETWEDWALALNGLQLENQGLVTRLAAAVDANLTTIKMAVTAKADLLLVHHGLFWNSPYPWTGRRYELLRLLLDHNVAVYSSHLPLDGHPKLGNNVQLCHAMGLKAKQGFFSEKGRTIGVMSQGRIQRTELHQRLQQAVGHDPILIPAGPAICRRIGIVSGAAGDQLKRAVAEGVDTLVTGEGPHWTYNLAEELEINVLYGGHYATETFGVKALAEALARKFNLPWIFLDNPSGL